MSCCGIQHFDNQIMNEIAQNTKSLPKLENRIEVMKLSIAIETTSPIEAANGVAVEFMKS